MLSVTSGLTTASPSIADGRVLCGRQSQRRLGPGQLAFGRGRDGQQALHGRQLLPQLSLLNDRENGAGQANRLSIS